MTIVSNIRVRVDCTNPGQFFACCGLLELADRLWPGAQGWFDAHEFAISCEGNLGDLLNAVGRADFTTVDTVDEDEDIDGDDDDDDEGGSGNASPIHLGNPFRLIRLDWWQDSRSGGKGLKVWAGSMNGPRIGRSMQRVLGESRFNTSDLFNLGTVVYDLIKPTKKVEPFYFDARRAIGAHSRDVGFSPDKLKIKTVAYPAVEFFCLVGLQRALPVPAPGLPRVFDYRTWGHPLPPELVPLTVSGNHAFPSSNAYRFENWFRTGQRKHKAFRPAQPITLGNTP